MKLEMLLLMLANARWKTIPCLCSSEGKTPFPHIQFSLEGLESPCRKQTWWHAGGCLHLQCRQEQYRQVGMAGTRDTLVHSHSQGSQYQGSRTYLKGDILRWQSNLYTEWQVHAPSAKNIYNIGSGCFGRVGPPKNDQFQLKAYAAETS